MTTELRDKPRCPYSKSTGGFDPERDEYVEGCDMCDLVDKWCLLDGGQECETYNDFLRGELAEES